MFTDTLLETTCPSPSPSGEPTVPAPRLRVPDRSVAVPDCTLEDTLPSDHPARILWAYVQGLDLSAFLHTIQAVVGTPGRNATDPRLLVALWMYATTDAVVSARELDRLCTEHSAYRWLCGGVSVNYHLLADFRWQHADPLEQLFQTHIAALMQQDLITLTRVALDGMRVRASAGASSFRRAETIEQLQRDVQQHLEDLKALHAEPHGVLSKARQGARERHAKEQLERLAAAHKTAQQIEATRQEYLRIHPKEAQERSQRDPKTTASRASTTDPEARKIKMPDGGTRPGYNVQLATTTAEGIIVGVDVTAQGNDCGLLAPMLASLEAAHGGRPEELLVDAGFASNADIETAHAQGTAVYMPPRNEAADTAKGKNPYAPKKGDQAGMKAFRERMGTSQAKTIYKLRASTAEWVNARMRQRGVSAFVVRGLAKVKAVMVWHAWVHNVWQAIRRFPSQMPAAKA